MDPSSFFIHSKFRKYMWNLPLSWVFNIHMTIRKKPETNPSKKLPASKIQMDVSIFNGDKNERSKNGNYFNENEPNKGQATAKPSIQSRDTPVGRHMNRPLVTLSLDGTGVSWTLQRLNNECTLPAAGRGHSCPNWRRQRSRRNH